MRLNCWTIEVRSISKKPANIVRFHTLTDLSLYQLQFINLISHNEYILQNNPVKSKHNSIKKMPNLVNISVEDAMKSVNFF